MKKLLSLILFLTSIAGYSQQLVVNVSDNTVLQYNSAFVKQKVSLLDFKYPTTSAGDFYIKVSVSFFQNNSGAYGAKLTDLITTAVNNQTISSERGNRLFQSYGDQVVEYTSVGKCVDALATGNLIPCPTVNPISDASYWNQFFENQIAGMAATTATQPALGAIGLIQKAIITQMNTRQTF